MTACHVQDEEWEQRYNQIIVAKAPQNRMQHQKDWEIRVQQLTRKQNSLGYSSTNHTISSLPLKQLFSSPISFGALAALAPDAKERTSFNSLRALLPHNLPVMQADRFLLVIQLGSFLQYLSDT